MSPFSRRDFLRNLTVAASGLIVPKVIGLIYRPPPKTIVIAIGDTLYNRFTFEVDAISQCLRGESWLAPALRARQILHDYVDHEMASRRIHRVVFD